MRLVDRQQRDRQPRHGGEERGRPEALGGHVHQPVLTAAQRPLPLLPFGFGEGTVDEGGAIPRARSAST